MTTVEHRPLQEQVALITGGSRGIGRAIALRLAAAGANVCINYNNSADAAQRTVRELEDRGVEAFAVAANVAQEDQVDAMVKAVADRWGRLDILVNNAGIIRDKLLMRMTPQDWDAVLDTNLRGTFLTTHAAIPHMVRQRYGRIINITSVIGLTGNPGQSNYAASKAGVIALTISLAREVATRNITVNAIAPGFVETEIVAHLTPEHKQKVVERIPMGRFGTPEDIAGAALFLCGPDGGYITGQVLRVDGGLIN